MTDWRAEMEGLSNHEATAVYMASQLSQTEFFTLEIGDMLAFVPLPVVTQLVAKMSKAFGGANAWWNVYGGAHHD